MKPGVFFDAIRTPVRYHATQPHALLTYKPGSLPSGDGDGATWGTQPVGGCLTIRACPVANSGIAKGSLELCGNES